MLKYFPRHAVAPAEERPWNLGPDLRAYAIGDIHGRDDLFADLLQIIADDDKARPRKALHLILLGDLVDRGPHSRRVIERRMALAASGGHVHLLKGNHEEVFAAAARGDARAARFHCRIGGAETLASYGLAEADGMAMEDDELAAWMLSHIPREHVDFVDAFKDMVEIGDYLFVHAGIRPRVSLARQNSVDLRWIRGEFLDYDGPYDRLVIHGHSIVEDVDIRPNRIGIETGAYFSGRLTAIGLEGTDRWFLQTGG